MSFIKPNEKNLNKVKRCIADVQDVDEKYFQNNGLDKEKSLTLLRRVVSCLEADDCTECTTGICDQKQEIRRTYFFAYAAKMESDASTQKSW